MIPLLAHRDPALRRRLDFQEAVLAYGAAVAGRARFLDTPQEPSFARLVGERLATVLSAYDAAIAAAEKGAKR